MRFFALPVFLYSERDASGGRPVAKKQARNTDFAEMIIPAGLFYRNLYIISAAATPAFSDSTPPCIGMKTFLEACVKCKCR